MSRLSSGSLLGIFVLFCLHALPSAARTPQAAPAATGLIIGFKDAGEEGPLERARRADLGPWASDRERSRALWDRSARQERERVARLARDTGVALAGAAEAGNARLMRFGRPLQGRALDNALRRVRLHPDVAWAEPDVLLPRLQTAPVTPNDALFGLQWHLQAPDAIGNFSGMNLPAAWATTTGSPVVVAVVDSGVRFDHPDLAGRLLPGHDLVSELAIANDGDGRDADASDPGDWVSTSEAGRGEFEFCDPSPSVWHGTFIAGQIAAASNNGEGVSGMNWGARILPVRVAGKCGARLSDLLDGLRWAAGLPVAGLPANTHPARVVNLSFGGDAPCSSAYQATIDAVTQAGALVVVAGGNESTHLTRPADCERVMAVGAVRKDGAKAAYASFGSRLALSAPGGSNEQSPDSYLVSTDNTGVTVPGAHSYGFKQGSSFAAPQAAGVASLMLGVNPMLTPSQLIARMKAGARPHAVHAGLPQCSTAHPGVCNCTTATCGTGLLDAERSVQLATGPAVVIAPLGAVEPGSVVALDGRQSTAIPGSSIVSYQWQQLQGPDAGLSPAGAPQASATLVSEATYVFQLTVQDDLGRGGVDTVTVVAAMPAPAGGGGGASGLWWGLSLWAWVLAVAWSQRRRAWRPLSARGL